MSIDTEFTYALFVTNLLLLLINIAQRTSGMYLMKMAVLKQLGMVFKVKSFFPPGKDALKMFRIKFFSLLIEQQNC